MNNTTKFLLMILLPAIAPLIYPPLLVMAALPLIIISFALLVLLGVFVWRGRSWALRLMIFVLGISLIAHIMMFFPHAKTPQGITDIPYITTSILSMGLSLYLVLRLDQTDIRTQMVD